MITVYYSAYSKDKQIQEYCHEPEPVLGTIFENLDLKPGDAIKKCPAFTGLFKNIYKIKSSYDYDITWNGSEYSSTMYDQYFFNNTIIQRDLDVGIFSYLNPGIYFFADCKSLELETVTPIYEKDMIYDGVLIPGKYDCANHFRKLECSIKLKKPQRVEIHNGDTLYYTRFHTEEKIKFVRFQITPEMVALSSALFDHRRHTTKITPLSWYYTIMKKHYNKKFLKLIKDNILE
jgi:hypothetical protein